MSIGLRRGTVKLEEHDPAWDESAREVIGKLYDILGDDAKDIQHIGSTSIRQIVAKPIVDIAVGVDSLEDMARHDKRLSEAGFIFRGSDVREQILYVLGEEDMRTHHIHVVIWGERDWQNYILFRDYLNAHSQEAQEYASLKVELGEKFKDSRGEYTENKQAFIDRILLKAREWKRNGSPAPGRGEKLLKLPETERLYLRKLEQADFDDLCKILQDEETMYAYEGAFTDEEAQGWLERQLERYRELGFGLWAVILKESGQLIGQCGLTIQPWKEREVLEIGYLFRREFWHRGYAAEAARACREYAFQVLGAEEVCSIIRDTNTASQNVAIRNGMAKEDSWVKHFRGVDMPHYRYVVRRAG